MGKRGADGARSPGGWVRQRRRRQRRWRLGQRGLSEQRQRGQRRQLSRQRDLTGAARTPEARRTATRRATDIELPLELASTELDPEARQPYTLWDERFLALEDGRLRLYYSTADAYEARCALQPALPVPATEDHNCLGARGVARASDGRCYAYDDETTAFYAPGEGEGIIPDPAREVDCARAFACIGQCACLSPEPLITAAGSAPLAAACIASNPHVGELLLRRVGDELVGVFGGDASFFQPNGARTQIGQVRFERLVEP